MTSDAIACRFACAKDFFLAGRARAEVCRVDAAFSSRRSALTWEDVVVVVKVEVWTMDAGGAAKEGDVEEDAAAAADLCPLEA